MEGVGRRAGGSRIGYDYATPRQRLQPNTHRVPPAVRRPPNDQELVSALSPHHCRGRPQVLIEGEIISSYDVSI